MFHKKVILAAVCFLNLKIPTTLADNSQCILYTDGGQSGKSLNVVSQEASSFQAELDSSFNDQISSVWVRYGYALEIYKDRDFGGELLVLSGSQSENSSSLENSEGTVFEFKGPMVSFDNSVSSYRCRMDGPMIEIYRGQKIPWFESTRFSWRSDGNHPNHVWVEMTSETHSGSNESAAANKRLLKIHGDKTYGSSRQDYTIDVDSGLVTAQFNESGYAKGTVTFDLTLGLIKPEFKAFVLEMAKLIDTVANTPQSVFGTVSPPRKELAPVAKWLLEAGTF